MEVIISCLFIVLFLQLCNVVSSVLCAQEATVTFTLEMNELLIIIVVWDCCSNINKKCVRVMVHYMLNRTMKCGRK